MKIHPNFKCKPEAATAPDKGLLGVVCLALVLAALRMMPEWAWKRQYCGGVWIYYQTSLPMAPIWVQCADKKASLRNQRCEAHRIKVERHGKCRFLLHSQNDKLSDGSGL